MRAGFMSSPGSGSPRRRLIIIVCLGCALITIFLGGVVSSLLERSLRSYAKAQTAAIVTEIAQRELEPRDFHDLKRGQAALAVRARTADLVNLPGVIRTRLYGPAMQIVWSDLAEEIGRGSADDPELRQAFDGQPVAAFRSGGSRAPLLPDQARDRWLMSLLVPVRFPGQPGVAGVVEITQDLETLRRRNSTARQLIWGVSVSSAALLSFGLYGLIRHASGTIARQHQDLERSMQRVVNANREWERTFNTIADPLFIHDREFKVLRANAAMGALQAARHAAGGHCYEALGRTESCPGCPFPAILQGASQRTSVIEAPALGRIFRVRSAPIRDEAGEIVGAIEMASDITDEQTIQQQLYQADKLAAVGQLVAGVAHELNNPLAAVVGNAELLLAAPGADLAIARRVQVIREESIRASRIVQKLLTFARQHRTERRRLSMNEVVERSLDLMEYQLRAQDVRLVRELSANLPPVWGDFFQWQQVLFNLLSNAQQAMTPHGGGTLIVRTSPGPLGVRIVVEDSGPGIAPGHLNKIFDPFFTTKAVGQGTGLGLSICYGIVREHAGQIRADNVPGGGARFLIDLPAAPATLAEAPDSPVLPPAPAAPRGARILVVDDEPNVMRFVVEALRRSGHRAEGMTRGDEALDQVREHGADLVIADFRMPGMGGEQLHQRLAELRNPPEMILMTGDALSRETLMFLERTKTRHLVKPFRIQELASIVDEAVAARRIADPSAASA
jgi:signal transduction histidine kinase/CheY-like chemotaxis protein